MSQKRGSTKFFFFGRQLVTPAASVFPGPFSWCTHASQVDPSRFCHTRCQHTFFTTCLDYVKISRFQATDTGLRVATGLGLSAFCRPTSWSRSSLPPRLRNHLHQDPKRPNFDLKGGAKCGKRSSPFPSNATVRQRNAWFFQKLILWRTEMIITPGTSPPHRSGLVAPTKKGSKDWVVPEEPEPRSAEKSPLPVHGNRRIFFPLFGELKAQCATVLRNKRWRPEQRKVNWP